MANSDSRFIYANDDGSISIVIPSDDCGLTLDEDNQSDLTEDRIYKWTKQISNEFNKSFEEKHDKVVIQLTCD